MSGTVAPEAGRRKKIRCAHGRDGSPSRPFAARDTDIHRLNRGLGVPALPARLPPRPPAPYFFDMSTKPAILVLCTGNSCRSHMAEGFLRAAVGDSAEVFSAGSKPAGYVHPLSIKVMAEAGVDISAHTSKHMNEFLPRRIDVVITVCGNADQVCPMYPGQVARFHWGFDDPAHAKGTEEEILREFRRVRDEIKAKFTAYGTAVKAGQLQG